MQITSVTNQTVTSASGTVAIASASTSKGVLIVTKDAPTSVVQSAMEVVTIADIVAISSFVVLLLSSLWNVYSSRKMQQIESKNHELESRKLDMDRDRFNIELEKYRDSKKSSGNVDL